MDNLVSIITPCYNGAKYLPGYFNGILSQKHRNIELIFVNDGSTDNTEKIANEYGKRLVENGMQFVYIYQENSGQAAAINKGLSIFNGDFLMWLDSDDIMLPENITQKLALLNEHSEFDFAVSEIEFVEENDIDKIVKFQKRVKSEGEDSFFEDLLYSRNIVWGPGTVLVRRAHVLKSIPSRHIYESKEGQNWQLMLPISYSGRCGYVEMPLLKCVVHSDSHSRQKRSLQEELIREANFIIICTETINTLSEMPEKEKEKWNRKVRVHHNQKKLFLALSNRDKETFKIVKKELKEDDCKIKLRQRYYLFLVVRLIKKTIGGFR